MSRRRSEVGIAPPVEPARLFVLHVRQQVPGGKYVDITLMSGATIRVTAADITDFRLSFLRTELVQAIAASKAAAPSSGAASPQGVLPQQEAQAVIRAKCASDWPEDFRMRAYCQEQQDAGYAALSRRAMGGSADQQTIRAKCAKDWPDDFRMRNYCEEKQLDALRIIR